MIEFAIVGLGAWGLCVLESDGGPGPPVDGTRIRVHLVEPGQLGGGVYSASQPDYLVLNNACGQLSLYASPNSDEHPPYAVGLYEWAVVRGLPVGRARMPDRDRGSSRSRPPTTSPAG